MQNVYTVFNKMFIGRVEQTSRKFIESKRFPVQNASNCSMI